WAQDRGHGGDGGVHPDPRLPGRGGQRGQRLAEHPAVRGAGVSHLVRARRDLPPPDRAAVAAGQGGAGGGRGPRAPGTRPPERYVLGRLLSGVGAWLAVITAVILLIQYVDLSSQVGTRTDVGAGDLFRLTLLRSPSLVQVLLPFCFLFGGITAFVGLNRRSE